MTRLPIRCLWIATGNNPEFSNEMARRLVRIRLDAHVDRPWRRDGFRHPDLMVWVRANRAAAGRRLPHPLPGLDRGGPAARRRAPSAATRSGRSVGGVLEVAGIEGFLGNLDEMMEASDSEGAAWRRFVAAWWDRFGTARSAPAICSSMRQICDPPLPIARRQRPGTAGPASAWRSRRCAIGFSGSAI